MHKFCCIIAGTFVAISMFRIPVLNSTCRSHWKSWVPPKKCPATYIHTNSSPAQDSFENVKSWRKKQRWSGGHTFLVGSAIDIKVGTDSFQARNLSISFEANFISRHQLNEYSFRKIIITDFRKSMPCRNRQGASYSMGIVPGYFVLFANSKFQSLCQSLPSCIQFGQMRREREKKNRMFSFKTRMPQRANFGSFGLTPTGTRLW